MLWGSVGSAAIGLEGGHGGERLVGRLQETLAEWHLLLVQSCHCDQLPKPVQHARHQL